MIPVHDDNPTHLKPWVTWGLIAGCALVFLWQWMAGDVGLKGAIAGLGLIPSMPSAAPY